MADVEDQAANVSAEEQIQFTTIQTLQNDILSGTFFLFFSPYFANRIGGNIE